MIYCPNCGTANRDGSKFCNECGQRLAAPEHIVCAACGASNPPKSVFCSECGARLTTGEESPAEPAAAPSVSEELPDWLQRLQGEAGSKPAEPAPPAQPAPAEPATPAPPALIFEEEEALPQPPSDWLSQLRRAAAAQTEGSAPAEAEATPAPEPPDFAGLPLWLADKPLGADVISAEPAGEMRAASGEEGAPAETPAEEPAPQRSTPTSLLDRLAAPAPEAPAVVEQPPAAEATPPIVSPEAVQEQEEEGALPPLAPAEIPDWLRELGAAPSVAGVEPETPIGGLEGAPAEAQAADLPDWLRAAAPAEEPAEEEIVEGGLARAHIPDWLKALRPDVMEGRPGLVSLSEGEVGAAGVLQGIRGIVPVELAVVTPPDTGQVGSLLSAVPAESDAGKIFSSVVATQAPAQAVPGRKVSVAPWTRAILALLLLLAIFVPLLTGATIFTTSTRPVPDLSGIQGLRAAVDNLQPGQAVIVAFDFDPSTADEMNPIADAIVGHIMSRQARILAVSALPAGPALAQHSIERVAAAQGREYLAGRDFANLGYVAGKEAGLRSLVTGGMIEMQRDFTTGDGLAGQEAVRGVETLRDAALIVELAASQETVRWWVEQVRSQVNVPMVAGVSAAVEPYVRPYAGGDTPQLAGLLAGIAEAALYQSAGAKIDLQVEALSWAVGLAIIVILVAVFIAPLVDRERGV
jgi:hypothetical protein